MNDYFQFPLFGIFLFGIKTSSVPPLNTQYFGKNGGAWRKSPNTRFPLTTFLYAGYSVKLKTKKKTIISMQYKCYQSIKNANRKSINNHSKMKETI